MKFRHVSSLYPFVAVGLVLACVASYIGSKKFFNWCGQHHTVSLWLALVLIGVLIYQALGRVKPEDLSQTKYPSSPTRW